MLADEFPNFSICGLPFYLSGETPDWQSLAHRTEFSGITLLPSHTAERPDSNGSSGLDASFECGTIDLPANGLANQQIFTLDFVRSELSP